MLKIANLVGARPQFIKAAALSRVLRGSYSHQVEEIVIHSGQHYDKNLSQVFFDELEIPKPSYNLGIGSGSHAEQTGEIMITLEKLLQQINADVVIVYGDTNTTLAGALAAVKLNIPVAHIEGGLRSGKLSMPEEVNRITTDAISKFIFCPTEAAAKNINKQTWQHVINSGDIMFDTALYYHQKTNTEVLEKYQLKANHYTLCTVHRDFNTDNKERLQNILQSFNELTEISTLVFPVHPRTVKCIEEHGLTIPEKLKTIAPVSYLEMLALEANAQVVITDSGGVQKEAYFFEKPCIVLREESEWFEIANNGYAALCDVKVSRIKGAFKNFNQNPPKEFKHFYGNGHAAELICKTLVNELC